MPNYPYGRRGRPVKFYDEKATKSELKEAATVGDNEVSVEGELIYLYEAPAEDDPARGHFSAWKETSDGMFEKQDAISGDDGMCYKKYKNKIQ